ncbi:type II toxin-antitoxin system toxin DNA ADP-ribosyl transferase DarT [Aliarcobacter butzleri]|uniref:type II toxin-antitoxin system toxin DNA ADP-ribosyl transferase DarT n=1 Tax=Aliarcobacter butzleri TaxID=28197 RepID=UPI0021B6E5B9|nr:DUF4433 domain-containing protein [Aliarcobacter butzleri]MCT7636406.1 DUF4433 domain-containing protein [Aliarcobacter butzleri]
MHNLKIYHIVHIDKLQSIINSGGLLSDSEVIRQGLNGTTIGMNSIKQRRLNELTLSTYPDLFVGQCVPFYFCPRSVMLYMMSVNSCNMEYQGGQDNIIHLEADFMNSIYWANSNGKRWVFTSSNAGSRYFQDTNNIANLSQLNWNAINARYWNDVVEEKQAEFLCEHSFEWSLIHRIGVSNQTVYQQVLNIINSSYHKPYVEVKNDWYY